MYLHTVTNQEREKACGVSQTALQTLVLGALVLAGNVLTLGWGVLNFFSECFFFFFSLQLGGLEGTFKGQLLL